jgi:hypothetical protein
MARVNLSASGKRPNQPRGSNGSVVRQICSSIFPPAARVGIESQLRPARLSDGRDNLPHPLDIGSSPALENRSTHLRGGPRDHRGPWPFKPGDPKSGKRHRVGTSFLRRHSSLIHEAANRSNDVEPDQIGGIAIRFEGGLRCGRVETSLGGGRQEHAGTGLGYVSGAVAGWLLAVGGYRDAGRGAGPGRALSSRHADGWIQSQRTPGHEVALREGRCLFAYGAEPVVVMGRKCGVRPAEVIQFEKSGISIAERLWRRGAGVGRRNQHDADNLGKLVPHPPHAGAEGIGHIQIHAAAGAARETGDQINAGAIRPQGEPRSIFGEREGIVGERFFEFRLDFAHDRSVVVAKCEAAEQPQTHRLRRAGDPVEQLRVEPPLGQVAAVEARLHVMRCTVQTGGENVLRSQRRKTVVWTTPHGFIQCIRIAVDIERANQRRHLRRSELLGQFKPEPLQHAQARLPNPNDESGAQRTWSGQFGWRGREDRSGCIGDGSRGRCIPRQNEVRERCRGGR